MTCALPHSLFVKPLQTINFIHVDSLSCMQFKTEQRKTNRGIISHSSHTEATRRSPDLLGAACSEFLSTPAQRCLIKHHYRRTDCLSGEWLFHIPHCIFCLPCLIAPPFERQQHSKTAWLSSIVCLKKQMTRTKETVAPVATLEIPKNTFPVWNAGDQRGVSNRVHHP